MRYRYITCGAVKATDKISKFRLVCNRQIKDDAIRVHIPDDLILEKYSCDNYSTTEDNRTIEDLGYDVVCKLDGKWIVMNELKSYQSYEFSDILREKYNYYITQMGYLSRNKYSEYIYME